MTDDQTADIKGRIARSKFPVKDMRRIFIRWLKAKQRVEMVSAIRIDGRRTLMLGRRGTIYCSHEELGQYKSPAAPFNHYPWGAEIMLGLLRLGVITQAQHDQHMAELAALREQKKRDYHLRELLRFSEEHGFKIYPDQLKALSPHSTKEVGNGR